MAGKEEGERKDEVENPNLSLAFPIIFKTEFFMPTFQENF